MLTSWLEIGLAALGLCLVAHLRRKKPTAPLPPGPKPLPLLGNVFDMPSDDKPWLTWAKLGKQYGDISSLTVFGQTLVILNSVQVALEMLEMKGSKYSDRPVVPMGGELAGWNRSLVLVPYGEEFRNHRKFFHRILGTPASIQQFYSVEESEARKFLRCVLKKPDDFLNALKNVAGSLILRITYGYTIQEEGDPLVALAIKANDEFSAAVLPGAYLVDVLPVLRYVPEFFPGAGFKKVAKDMLATLNELATTPFQMVKDQLAAGTAAPSYVSALLNDPVISKEEERTIQWSAAGMYSGGADTSGVVLHVFFLVMILYPEVQEKARAEIDAVCGPDNLPTFADRENLPYVDAICKELHRFHTIAPTAVPHRVTEDDIHDGFFIPKGALVIPNLWAMNNDSRIFPDPSKFDPTRYLGPNPQPDPRGISFGFGRRICPGRALADATIFLICAQTLAVFDITRVVENGVVDEPVHEQTGGLLSRPGPFKCNIKPRSEKAVSLIMADY